VTSSISLTWSSRKGEGLDEEEEEDDDDKAADDDNDGFSI